MRDIPIKRSLNEDTRKQGIFVLTNDGAKVFSMHITDNEVIITDNSDYSKIFAIYSKDYYKLISEGKALSC